MMNPWYPEYEISHLLWVCFLIWGSVAFCILGGGGVLTGLLQWTGPAQAALHRTQLNGNQTRGGCESIAKILFPEFPPNKTLEVVTASPFTSTPYIYKNLKPEWYYQNVVRGCEFSVAPKRNSTNRPELWQDKFFSLRFGSIRCGVYASNSNVTKTAAAFGESRTHCTAIILHGRKGFLPKRNVDRQYISSNITYKT